MRVECGFSLPFLSPLGDIPLQILSDDPQCVDGPNVADWVAALVGWPKNGIWRAGAPHVVGKGRVRLQGVASKKCLKHTDGNIVFLLASIQITDCLKNALTPLQILCVAAIAQCIPLVSLRPTTGCGRNTEAEGACLRLWARNSTSQSDFSLTPGTEPWRSEGVCKVLTG